jgi:hypothetical protein
VTLRVRISIVPFGDEEKEQEIHQINISNISKDHVLDTCLYGVEMDKYKTGEYDTIIDHLRSAGALKLVHGVFDDLELGGMLNNKAT